MRLRCKQVATLTASVQRAQRRLRAKGQSNWSRERGALPSTYCKHILRLKFIVNRDGRGFESRPLAVNKPNGLWKFATFARCLCLLPSLFLFLRKNLPSRPYPALAPSPSRRFRFYLSKVFHSVVIV